MTQEFQPEATGQPITFSIGRCSAIHFRDTVPDVYLALFRDGDWESVERGENLFLGDMEHDYRLASTCAVILPRLRLYGITDDVFNATLSRCRIDLNTRISTSGRGGTPWASRMREFYAAVDSIDAMKPFFAAMVAWDLEAMAQERNSLPGLEELINALFNRDPRLVLYGCAIAAPDAVATLDLTQVVSVDAVGGDWIRPDATLANQPGVKICSAARDRLSANAAMPPLRVLTEGRTDAEFIRTSIALIRPEVQDLIQFMNPQAKPEQNASALARMVNHLSAQGAIHPAVALFDNDTAGLQALSQVQRQALPVNIRVTPLPPNPSARQYPTLAPGSSAILIEDINGRASSIEMFLGSDVLAGTPIAWSSTAVDQGSFPQPEKDAIKQRYRAKVEAAKKNGGPVPGQDWDGMRLVIDHILDVAAAMW